MYDFKQTQQAIDNDGFAIIDSLLSDADIHQITSLLSVANKDGSSFRKSKDVFAIRRVLKEVPEIMTASLREKIVHVIGEIFGQGYFIVKSIYFDKPANSNWFVAYHQDLSISVNSRAEVEGYGPWTIKDNAFNVQPPTEILRDNFTIRVHLDDTNEHNGALRVIPGSHLQITRPEVLDKSNLNELTCCVTAGGFMIMRPLLMHASSRSAGDAGRRVLHIEFSRAELPSPLTWAERQSIT